jgi:hypothetical protein
VSALNEPVAKRIGKLVRMFSASSKEDENVANVALTMLRQLLIQEQLSFNDLATVIENWNGEIEELKYSDSDLEAVFNKGVEKGRSQNNGRKLSRDFFDDDGEPRWLEIARFCQNNPDLALLKPNEQQFIEEQVYWLQRRSAPRRPSGGFLLSIFWKLGGSLR